MKRLLLLVAVGFAVTGCVKSPSNPPVALPSDSPAPTATAAPTPTAAPSGNCQGSINGGAGPARAGLQAWLCDDKAEMQEVMEPLAVTDLSAVPRDIDLQFTYVRCDGAAGSNYCIYRNVFGSDLVFRVPTQPNSKVLEVQFDRTRFHTDADQYTRHFIEAWRTGNVPRLQALAQPDVVSFAATHPAPASGYTVTLSPSEVWIFEVASSGADYRLVIQNQLGRSNAITGLTILS